MINTLQNSPERIPSKWGNKFKKAVALAIALTLSGEPAEAKTYEKQEFPTEMLASIPSEYAPMTENVEQTTVPNYINQAQNWVKKYYPKYEEYFRPIFKELKWMSQTTNNIFNKKIHENFDIFEEELTTEKDKYTTILIAIDDILWEKIFINWKKTIDTKEWEDLLKSIASEITSDIKVQFSKNLRESRQRLANEKDRLANEKDRLANEKDRLANEKDRLANEKDRLAKTQEKLAKIRRIREDIVNSNNPQQNLKSIEELFKITEINELKSNNTIQEIVKYYISIWNKINWTPSTLWKKFIEEYNKLK